MQGISCNASLKPDCNFVMPYGIIAFYIPASIRDYFHVLHMGEEAMNCHVREVQTEKNLYHRSPAAVLGKTLL